MTVFFGQSFQEYQNHLECFIIKKLVLFSYSVMSNSLQPHGLQHTRVLCSPFSWSLLKFMSAELVMLSNHLILCRHLLLLPSVFPSVGLFHWDNSLHEVAKVLKASALASVLPLNMQGWFPLGLTGLISLQSRGLSGVLSNTTVQKYLFFSTQPVLSLNSHIHTWLLEKPQLWLIHTFVVKVMSLPFNTLSGFVIAFLARSIF